MTSSDHTTPHDEAGRGAFPRIELPPVPSFRRTRPEEPAGPVHAAPATSIDGRPVGGQDDAAGGWQYPYAQAGPSGSGSTRQAVPPAQAPVAPVAPAPSTRPYVMPQLEQVSDSDRAADRADDADTGPSTVVLVVFAVLAIALLWASRMAFSAGLLAFGSLLMAELSLAFSFARRSGASRPASSTILAIGALLVAVNAARHALGQFGETAFVAGLFVLVAGIPTLLLLGVAALLLRRSSAPSRANDALQSWTLVRLGALSALLAAGFQAHRTFSAKPDAIVALGIVVLVLLTSMSVLRGTGRAARPGSSAAP